MASKIKVEVNYGATSWRSLRAKKKAEYYRCKQEMLEEKAKYAEMRGKTEKQETIDKAKYLFGGKWMDDMFDALQEIGLNPLGFRPITPIRFSKFISKKVSRKN